MTVLLGLTLVTLTVYGAYRITRQVCDKTSADVSRPGLQGPPAIEYAPQDEADMQDVIYNECRRIMRANYRRTMVEPWTGRTARDKKN